MKTLLAISILSLSFAGIATASDNIYVQSKSAKIMTAPTFNSKVAGTVKRGAKLEVTETGKGWYKVSSSHFSGWVNRLNVTKDTPKERISLVKNSDIPIKEEARRRSSALTSAVSARGLSEKERERASSLNNPDYRKLEKLEDEAKKIPEKSVENFSKNR